MNEILEMIYQFVGSTIAFFSLMIFPTTQIGKSVLGLGMLIFGIRIYINQRRLNNEKENIN